MWAGERASDTILENDFAEMQARGINTVLLQAEGFNLQDFRSFVGKAVKLVDDFEAGYSYVANDGDRFVFRTNLDAPNYKLVSALSCDTSP